jgi:hypothetical protein
MDQDSNTSSVEFKEEKLDSNGKAYAIGIPQVVCKTELGLAMERSTEKKLLENNILQ